MTLLDQARQPPEVTVRRKHSKEDLKKQYQLLLSIKRFPVSYPNSWVKLSRAQKAHVYRKLKEYTTLLQSAGRFVARRVSSEKTIKRLIEAGFDCKGGIVLVPVESPLDKVHVSVTSVVITRPDGSYTRFPLGTREDACNLKLPKMSEFERVGFNLGHGNTNGFRDVEAHQKNYSVPSGAVSRDEHGYSVFIGNDSDNLRIYGWAISTMQSIGYVTNSELNKKSAALARHMRLNYIVGR